MVSALVGLPDYADQFSRVDFVVDTGAEASVLTPADWRRIIPPESWASAPANAGVWGADGTTYASVTRAVLQFPTVSGEQHNCMLDNLYLLLDPEATVPSHLGMDVMLRGGMAFDYLSGRAMLALP